MKRTYKDLTNDELADLHRMALGLTPVTVVCINRNCENLNEYPFVATRTEGTEDTACWWIEDNTLSVSQSSIAVNYLYTAVLAKRFGVGNEFYPFVEEENDLPFD